MCMYICIMYICTYTWLNMCVQVHMYVQLDATGQLSYHSSKMQSILFFETGSLPGLELMNVIHWLVSKSPGSPCFCLASARITSSCHHARLLYMGSGIWHGPSCVHSKDFTEWVISPASRECSHATYELCLPILYRLTVPLSTTSPYDIILS